MPRSQGLWLALAVALIAVAAMVLLGGCDLAWPAPIAIPSTPTHTPLPPDPTATPTPAMPPAPAVITLTLWTTEALSPTQASPTGQILAQQVAAFETAHPDVRLEFVLKKPYGKGGILDFLLTTAAVVPDLLPDLVFIDVDELNTAVQAGLVQPLDTLVPSDLVADLYPFAREASTFDRRLYGLQFQADLDHLVYNTGKMAMPPRSWPGVLSGQGPYIFPTGGQAGLVNDAFLIQYLAVRGQPADGPFLEKNSLAAVLQFYQDGLSRGVLPANITTYRTLADCWRDYLAGQAALVQVSAHLYLADRNRLEGSAVAPIPTINGPAAPIGRGWALAVVTSDPARQLLAAEFLAQLMSPEINGTWNLAANYLPTRQAALAFWNQSDDYVLFLQQQLQIARSRPTIPNYTQVATALQRAVEAVLSGTATPEEAAAQAVNDNN